MSLQELNQEFRNHLEDIMYSTVNINDPNDRVIVMKWIHKLQSLNDRDMEVATLRNHYTDYLRMTLSNKIIHLGPPFKEPPPEDNLRPLCEVLANYVATKCPPIPMTGPIQPIITRTDDEGKVFMTVQKSPDGGIFCYIAATPEGFDKQNGQT